MSIRRGFIAGLSTAALMAAIVCSADFLLWRHRARTGDHPYGSFLVTTYYVIPQKNNRVELLSGGRTTERCVHALIPHEGYAPCWYLARHTERRIEQ